MGMPELLSPAGSFEKLRAALLYGADAVYLAGNMFGMRAAAANFTDEELEEAVAYTHARGKKVYLTLNTMPREYEYDALKSYLTRIGNIGLDAFIIADIGVLASTDPIAIDQACIDLVYASDDPGRDHLLERIESRNGVLTIEAAAGQGYGSRAYELVEV